LPSACVVVFVNRNNIWMMMNILHNAHKIALTRFLFHSKCTYCAS
jgi:hypothetical protein